MAEGDVEAHKTVMRACRTAPMRLAGNKKRILIVDDDRAFLELAERLLMKEGFSAICTNIPRVVLQLARIGQARRYPARYPDA